MSAPASSSSCIVASTPSSVRLRPRVTRVPNSTPAAAISGVTPSLLGRSTSAPCFSSSSTNGASPARAARSNGVAPCARIVSPPRSCGTSRYGGRRLSWMFGLAPASSSILRDVERGDRVLARDHGHRAVALGRQRAHVGRHVQRRAAEQVPLVDVGAGLDHERGEIEVQVEQRHVERRDALRILEIGIGAGRDQVPRALDAAFARGVEQRREAALVHVLRPRLGDDLALPLADDAARVEVGAVRGQKLDHLGLALRRGPHQRRLAAPLFFGVDVGARLEQPPGGLDVAAARDGHQRRLAFRILGVGIGAGVEQRVDDRRRADDGRLGERGRAELVLQL